jgi:aryl-alcohol dehydrogenase-like predicted oxidoreductase
MGKATTIGASTGLLGAQIGSQIDVAQAQESQIRSQLLQQRLASTQKRVALANQARATISSQVAQGAARGVSAASPTFQAIQTKSFENFAKDDRAEALNLSFRENVLKQQIHQNKLAEEVGIISTLGQTAMQVAGGFGG